MKIHFTALRYNPIILLLLYLILCSLPLSAQKRVAFVIGNSEYKGAPLDNAGHDADAMKHFLINKLGFLEENVVMEENITRKTFFEKQEEFLKKAQGAEFALFYYAGHGMESVKGDVNYLIPAGVDVHALASKESRLKASGINVTEAIKEMDKELVGVPKMVILDCCRDRPTRGNDKRKGGGLAGQEGLKEATVVIFTAAPGGQASDGYEKDKQGPFVKHFLKHFAEPGVNIMLAAANTCAAIEDDPNISQIPYSNTYGRALTFHRMILLKGDKQRTDSATLIATQNELKSSFNHLVILFVNLMEDVNELDSLNLLLKKYSSSDKKNIIEEKIKKIKDKVNSGLDDYMEALAAMKKFKLKSFESITTELVDSIEESRKESKKAASIVIKHIEITIVETSSFVKDDLLLKIRNTIPKN